MQSRNCCHTCWVINSLSAQISVASSICWSNVWRVVTTKNASRSCWVMSSRSNSVLGWATKRLMHSRGFRLNRLSHYFLSNRLPQQVAQDSRLAQILTNTGTFPDFTLEQGRLFYKGRLVLPKSSRLISTLLHKFYDSPMGGRSGVFKMYKQLAAEWHWIGMKRDVQDFVADCKTSQRNKNQVLSPGGLLQPLPYPRRFGMILLWILLRFCQNPRVMILYCSWMIVRASMLISSLFATRLLPIPWLVCSPKK